MSRQRHTLVTTATSSLRQNIVDNRVHVCFYFLQPTSHSLKQRRRYSSKVVLHKVMRHWKVLLNVVILFRIINSWCRYLRFRWQWALHGLDLSSSIHFWHNAHKRPRLFFLFKPLWNFIAPTLTNCSLFLEAISSRFGVLDSTSLVALLLSYLLFSSLSVSPAVCAHRH
jgi:hypothetical protein